MSILDNMTIFEAAELIRDRAKEIAIEKNITEQEAWDEMLEEIKGAL